MKKLFILFLSTTFVAFGQSDQSTFKFKRFAVGINFSPDIAYRAAHNYYNTPEEYWEPQKEQDNSFYRPRLGFSTGGHVSYNITKRLSIESGAQFSLKGYRSKPSFGVILYGNEIYEGKMKDHYNFNFVDIPLSVNYVFFNNRLQMVATAGVTWNHMRHNSVKRFTQDDVNKDLRPVMIFHTPYRQNTFSCTVGLGIQYNVNERLLLKAVPTFRYAIIPIQTNLAKSAYHWNAGLNISCSVRIF